MVQLEACPAVVTYLILEVENMFLPVVPVARGLARPDHHQHGDVRKARQSKSFGHNLFSVPCIVHYSSVIKKNRVVVAVLLLMMTFKNTFHSTTNAKCSRSGARLPLVCFHLCKFTRVSM